MKFGMKRLLKKLLLQGQFTVADVLVSLDCLNLVRILIGLASARSYKIGVVGNNRLFGNAVFSEMALRIFLFFHIKLGDYKGRKVTEPDVWKKFLIWRYLWKCLQISPESGTLMFGWFVGWWRSFLRNGSRDFSDFLHEVRGL